MLILAFDTSGSAGTIALLTEGRVLAESRLAADRRSAQTLAAAIDGLLRGHRVSPGQLGLVATTVGPGSFTGLRVAITTAKTLAYATGAEVLGISTLEAIAHGITDDLQVRPGQVVEAALDAQRQELFVARFACEQISLEPGPPKLKRLSPDTIVAADAWLAALAPGTIVTGTGLQRIESQLPPGIMAVQPHLREVQAWAVGKLAWRDFQAGRRDDLWKLAPLYLRPSYAEEKAQRGPT